MFENKLVINWQEENDDKFQIVEFNGEFDSHTIKETKMTLLEKVNLVKAKCLVFDFSKLNYLNSEAISLLLQINDLLGSKNIVLVLVGVKNNVMDVLKVIGFWDTVQTYKNLEDFLNRKS